MRHTFSSAFTRFSRALLALACIAAAWLMPVANAANVVGFGGDGTGWTKNGGATITADVANITDDALNQTRSVFFNTPVMWVNGFTVSFVYTPGGSRGADGVTFCMHNAPAGASALGGGGGGFGYANITSSVALELNIYTGPPGGANGLFFGNIAGHPQIATNTDLNISTAPVNVRGGNPITVTMVYNAAANSLAVNMSEANTANTFSTTVQNANLQNQLGASGTAYVGFTGATGGLSASQTIRNFTFVNSVQVTSVTPPSGPPNVATNVTIAGSGFAQGATVKFGTTDATNPVVVNAGSITCTTPALAAGTVDVTVTNPDLQSGTLTGGYSFAVNPPPVLTGINPATGPTGGGTTVQLTGANFRAGATVQFGVNNPNGFTLVNVPAANVTVNSNVLITLNTPAAAPAGATGFTSVRVTNSDSTSATLASAFQYSGASPTVTSITPNNGPYNATTDVTINGTDFAPNITFGGSVKFGSVTATNLAWVSATKITATAPIAAGGSAPAVDVIVFNPDGPFGVGASLFTYTGLRDPENPANTQPGLFRRYYRFANQNAGGQPPLPNFANITPFSTAIQTAFQPFVAAGLDTGPVPNPFDTQTTFWSLQWTGYVVVPLDGIWTFYTSSDDGSTLFIGNTKVVANDFFQGNTERSGNIALKAGTHALKVQFAEGAGGYNLSVRFLGPNVAKQDIPDSQFVVDATPVITSVAPTGGPPAGGTAITINGQNFTNIGPFGDNPVLPPVSVNGVAATNVTVVSPTKITATTPPTSIGGPASVSVQTISGPVGTLAAGAPNGFIYDITTITWKGTVDSNWSTPGNWDLNRAPASGDAVVLTGQGSAPTSMDIANLALYSLTFNATTTTPRTVIISSPATSLSFQGVGGGITVNTAAANHTIAGPIALSSPLNVNIGANRNFTLSGVISGIAGNDVIFTGPGKLTLSNPNNSFAGATQVNNGSLAVAAINNGGANSSIGASPKASANLALNANAILQFTGASGASDRGLTIGTGSATIDVAAGSSLSFSGLVTGAGILTKTGDGQLVLGNLFNNFGGDTVNAGRLNAIGSGALGIGPVALNNNATLGLGSVPSVVSGFGGSGAGWSLNGGATVAGDVLTLTTNLGNQTRSAFYTTPQSYTGGFTTSFVYTAGGTRAADGVTFCLQNVNPTALGGGGGSLGYVGITPSAGIALSIYTSNNGPGIAACANGNITFPYTKVAPVSLISGDQIKVTITYSAPPVGTIQVDLLDLNNNSPFSITLPNADLGATIGAQTVYVGFTGATGGAVATQTIGSFTYTPNAAVPYPNNITVNGTATIDVNPSALVPTLFVSGLTMSANANLILNANVAAPLGQAYGLSSVATTLGAAPKFTVNNNGAGIGTLTLGGIDDGGSAKTVTKVGPGALGAGGAFINISNGTLFNISTGSMGIAGPLAMGMQATVDLATGTSLNLNTATATLGMLTGTGTVNLNGGVLTIGSTANNASGSFGGTITDGSVAGGIIKDGTGNFTLATGTAHTYTGPTTVTAGTLTVDGSIGNSSAVSVAGTGVLRGTGTVNSIVTADGQIFPGNTTGALGAKGTLTLKGMILNATGVVRVRVAGNNTAVTNDQLTVTGSTVTLASGSTLQLGMAVKGGAYVNVDRLLLNCASGNPLVNSFTNLIVTNQPGNPANTGLKVNYLDNANTNQLSVTIPTTGSFTGGGAAINPSNRVLLNLNGNVTPVTVDSFSARAEGGGNLIEWTLASEFKNAGFNIYRRGAGDTAWTKANATLLAGRLTDPGSRSYRFYDWAPVGVYEYRLESIDSVAGKGEFYTSLAGPVALDNSASLVSLEGLDAALTGVALERSAARAAELLREANHETFASRDAMTSRDRQGVATLSLENATNSQQRRDLGLIQVWFSKLEPSATVREIASAQPREAYARAKSNLEPLNPTVLPRAFQRPARTASSTVAKITSDKSGVMLVPQSMLPAGFNAHRVRIQREGRTLSALAVTGEGLLLYAPGYSDDYTNKDAFFLSATLAATQAGTRTQAQGLFAPGISAQTTTGATAATQFRDVYFDWDLRPYDYPPYFSSQYLTQGSAQSFSLSVENVGSGSASLMVNVWSLTPDAHALSAFVNGTAVGAASWTGGGKFMAAKFDLPSGVLHDGANQIELVTPDAGGTQIALLHSLSINYTQNLAGRISNPPNEIVNTAATARVFEIAGLSTSDLWVVDARYSDRAALVPYETQAQADGSYKARFTAQAGGTGKYLVAPAGSEFKPVSVSKRVLKAAPPVAYLATGPSQFGNSIQSLIATRTKEGIKGAFVDQEQLFDYYNYGRFGPDGIRNAVRALRPQYLLLAGRTSYDYRNATGNANVDTLCPSYLASTTFWAQTTSDAMFGDLGRGYPEVRIGRIPANTTGDCANAVRHILSYAGIGASGWRAQVTTDTVDLTAGNFAAEADAIIAANPSIAWSRNYMGISAASSAEANAAMTAAANGGADILIYNGHGSATHLGAAEPHILDTDSVQNWRGNVVFIAATCTFNWVAKDEQGYRSIPIQALTQSQGGMAASIGTTTYMNSQTACEFAKQLLAQTQAQGSKARWGDCLLKAQQWAWMQSQSGEGAWYLDLTQTESLLGDPAMPVQAKTATSSKPTQSGAF